MIDAFVVLIGAILQFFHCRRMLLLENLALRQQLATTKRRYLRPKLSTFDRFFWVLARRFWCGWKQTPIVVGSETVAPWHRLGFALYWRMISKARQMVGRQRISKEVRELIFRRVVENPTSGAPRIHGELPILGFDVSERTVSRWMKSAPRDPEPPKRWHAFLRNRREAIAAMDFFVAPTITFWVLYWFFVIRHDRRRILHLNITKDPSIIWIVQQLREAFSLNRLPGSRSSTGTANMESRFPQRCDPLGLGRCGPRSRALGKMVSRSDGSRVAAAAYWTTSLP
jgi:putative transposase